MALRRMVYDGEILVNMTSEGTDIPLSLQLIEGENIGAVSVSENGNNIVNGVEVNKYGRPIAYHVFQTDPLGIRSFNEARLPSTRAFLLHKPRRPSELRGVSMLALVLKRIHDVDEYMDADLIAARVAACFGAFVTSNTGNAPILGATRWLRIRLIVKARKFVQWHQGLSNIYVQANLFRLRSLSEMLEPHQNIRRPKRDA